MRSIVQPLRLATAVAVSGAVFFWASTLDGGDQAVAPVIPPAAATEAVPTKDTSAESSKAPAPTQAADPTSNAAIADEVYRLASIALTDAGLMSGEVTASEHADRALPLTGEQRAYVASSDEAAMELTATAFDMGNLHPRMVDGAYATIQAPDDFEVTTTPTHFEGNDAIDARFDATLRVYADIRDNGTWSPVTYEATRSYTLILVENPVAPGAGEQASAWVVADWETTDLRFEKVGGRP